MPPEGSDLLAELWTVVLTEIENRGVTDVCSSVCDVLMGLPDAVNDVWPLTTVQTRIIHPLGTRCPIACDARAEGLVLAALPVAGRVRQVI